MNKLKKLVAVLLSATILMSMTTLAVSANETSSEATAEVITDDFSITADNSMGSLIADAIENSEENSEQDTNSGKASSIKDIEVTGSTVSVKYNAAKDCTILVALYDENTDKMLASGKSSVLAANNTTDIIIETEKMPEAYILKAFMLDKHNAPIADVYTDIMHKTAMLELLAMSTNDFEEDEVLNLDENENTNFAIYSDDVIKFSMTNTQNILVSYDKANGIYIFENASNELLHLNKGNFIACDDNTDNIIIIKVKSVNVDGTTVTITEDTTSLNEVFDYVKIESKQGMEDAVINKESASNYISKVPQSVGASFDKDAYDLVFGKSDDRYDYSGGIDLNLELECNLYLSFSTLEIDLTFIIEFGAIFECEGELPEEELADLSENLNIKFPIVKGITVTCTPKIIVKFSGSAKVGFTATGEVGFEAGVSSDGSFFNEKNDISVKPSFTIEAEIFIGLDLGPDVTVVHKKIAKIDLDAIIGFTVTGALNFEGEDVLEKKESMHMCDLCIKGEINAGLTLEASITFLGEEYEFDPTFNLSIFKKDFYYSADMEDLNFGECPYKKYLVTVTVKDADRKPIANAKVTYSTDTKKNIYFGTTDKNGEVKEYLDGYHLDESGKSKKTGYYFYAEKNGETYYDSNITYPTSVQISYIYFDDNIFNLVIKAVDSDKQPVEGASVFVNYASNTMAVDGTTDANGLCSFTVEKSDTYNVTIMSGSYHLSETITATESGAIHEFILADEEPTTEPATEPAEQKETLPGPIPNKYYIVAGQPDLCGSAWDPADERNKMEFNTNTGLYEINYLNIPSGKHEFQVTENGSWTVCFNLEGRIGANGSNAVVSVLESGSSVTISFNGKRVFVDVYSPGVEPTTEPAEIIDSGKCGENAFWSLDSNYCLTISGSGKMDTTDIQPWSDYRSEITSVIVEEGITTIENYAFVFFEKLTNISLPKSLVSIGYRSFGFCTSLKNIDLPDALSELGHDVFWGCTKLESIAIPKNVKYINTWAFHSCDNLKKVTLPDGLLGIGDYAFTWCKNLETINLPDSIKSIGKEAFKACEKLDINSLPASLERIGEYAFHKCNSIKNIVIPNKLKEFPDAVFSYCSSLESVEFAPDSSLGRMEDFLFEGCIRLKTISLPDSLRYTGTATFSCCELLESVKLPNNNSDTTIGWCMFSGCKNLKSIEIPSQITTIRTNAFADCESLESIVIPKNVKEIDTTAFLRCTNLKTVTFIGEEDIDIDYGIFDNCTSLENVTLPKNLTKISDYMFRNCHNLKSISIPPTVTSIGKQAFSGCYSLENLELPANITNMGEETFNGCNNLKSFSISGGITEIKKNMFKGCKNLESVYIPEGVTYIGEYAFYDCTNLKEINLPSTVTSIEKYAFANCMYLEDLTLSDTLKTIGDYAFYYCPYLYNIQIPSSVQSIGCNAFEYCSSIELYFYGDFPNLGNNVFKGDTAYIYYPANNKTWTEDKFLPYGGYTRWYAYSDTPDTYKTAVSCAVPVAYNNSNNAVVSLSNYVSYNDLCKNTNYVIAVVKSSDVEDVLAADNLLNFNQYKSDENGCLSVNNIPVDETENFEILIFGKVKGDVNCDNEFDVNDITYIQMFIAHYKKEDGSEMIDIDDYEVFVSADFDDNGSINISDATLMQLTLAGIV